MPRAKKGGATKTPPPKELLPGEDAVEEEDLPLFELVVDSFDGLLPGSDGYDPDKDHLLIGAKYGSSFAPKFLGDDAKASEVTPYDFLTDPKTGLRAGQDKPPSSTSNVDLTEGLKTYTHLPPLYVWRRGMWLTEAIWDPNFEIADLTSEMRVKVELGKKDWPKEEKKVPAALFNYWLTSGEGVTGNYKYVLYKLPGEIASNPNPKHPEMWRRELKEPKHTYGFSSYNSKPKEPEKPTIPAGVRMRCPDCGHWFTMTDLAGHDQVCGKGDEADWAMMCHSDCGCETLDQACKPKPGFPRTKKAPITSNGGKEVAVADTSAA